MKKCVDQAIKKDKTIQGKVNLGVRNRIEKLDAEMIS